MPLFGSQHQALAEWLATRWWSEDIPVAIIQGFPGIGKTEIALQAMHSIKASHPDLPACIFRCPDTKVALADDLLLTIAEELADNGDGEILDRLERGEDTASIFAQLLTTPRLLVIDEAEKLTIGSTGKVSAPVCALLKKWADTEDAVGRLLLLSLREFEEDVWLKRVEIRRIDPLALDEAQSFLAAELDRVGKSNEVPPERRANLVLWLGRNPRAIRLMVSALIHDKLDDLMGLVPAPWENEDQRIAPELLRQFEQALLERAAAQLSPMGRGFFRRLSVLRRPVNRRGLEALAPEGSEMDPLLAELQARFMMEEREPGRYDMHPVIRATAGSQMSAAERRRAHAAAGRYHAAPFRAKQIVGTPRLLGGRFVEARYHFAMADSPQDLLDISRQFEAHFRATFQPTSPVPDNPIERDEQIAMLSALLKDGGAAGLEFLLARCLLARDQPGDVDRALPHARRSTGPEAGVAAWMLRIRTEEKVEGSAVALRVAREAIPACQSDAGVWSVYQIAAELMNREGNAADAMALLKRGVKLVPLTNRAPLYRVGAEILADDGRAQEAIEFLAEGLEVVPAEFAKFMLYDVLAAILTRNGAADEAIDLLLGGAKELTDSQGRPRLVEQAIHISFAEGRFDRIPTAEMEEAQRSLFELFLALARGDPESAALIGTQALSRHPKSGALVWQTAFAHLWGGKPGTAKELIREPLRSSFRRFAGASHMWLAALIALELGEMQELRSHLAVYLGRPLSEHEKADRRFLLTLWDESVKMWGDNPAFYYPILPPNLTGLKQTVTRRQHGTSALAKDDQLPPVPPLTLREAFEAGPIVSAMAPDEWTGLYVLGCYDRLKTVYAQQCRALSLIHALFHIRELNKGRRLGVVGGGAAGITAAAAAARMGADVVLWERAASLVPLQLHNTKRYVHPHIYHWPRAGSTTKRAHLPILDWHAGLSSQVAQQLITGFDQIRARAEKPIDVRLGQRIRSIVRIGDPLHPTGFRILGGEGGDIDEQVDVVIVAIGFGVEARTRLGVRTPAYWEDDSLDQAVHGSPEKPRRILVSGAGDGALIDILRAKIRDFRHEDIFDLLPQDDSMSLLERELERIEGDLERCFFNRRLPNVSLHKAYNKLVPPEALRKRLEGRIRKETDVWFNFMATERYTHASSVLNRYLVSVLCSLPRAVRPKWGALSENSISVTESGTYAVRFPGDSEDQLFDDIIVRHGPPNDFLASEFAEIAKGCEPLRGKLRNLGLTGSIHPSTFQFFSD
jgi:tetratricopeptide (TPR) repeat protein